MMTRMTTLFIIDDDVGRLCTDNYITEEDEANAIDFAIVIST